MKATLQEVLETVKTVDVCINIPSEKLSVMHDHFNTFRIFKNGMFNTFDSVESAADFLGLDMLEEFTIEIEAN